MPGDSFLKIVGPDIKGESIDDKHKEEIHITSWSWNVSNTGTTHQGTGGGGGMGNTGDITVSKVSDKSSPHLAFHCIKGTHFKEAFISVRKSGGDALPYYMLHLGTVLITGFSASHSDGGGLPSESLTLNFAKWKIIYQQQDEKGAKLGGEVIQTYDIAKTSAWA